MVMGKRFFGSVNLPIFSFSTAVQAVLVWKYGRRMDGLRIFKKLTLRDIAWLGGIMLYLLLILLVASSYLNFPEPQTEYLLNDSLWGVVCIVFKHMFTLEFWELWIRKALNTGFVEEVAFRGLVQNFLEKRYGKKIWILALASAIFGITHLGHGAHSLVNPLCWNWPYIILSTIAGLGFGLIYRKTGALSYSIAAHAAIDRITRTLFLMR